MARLNDCVAILLLTSLLALTHPTVAEEVVVCKPIHFADGELSTTIDDITSRKDGVL